MEDQQERVTQLLMQWSHGDRGALDALTVAVYSELRKIADGYLRRERSGHTLQPTALVNEAWLRLVKQEPAGFANRQRFFALAAQFMRRILVDHARALSADKRGGGSQKFTLPDVAAVGAHNADQFLILDEALTRLSGRSPRAAQVIEMRYFAGLTVEEMAALLDVSIATVSREQKAGEAWLGQELSRRS